MSVERSALNVERSASAADAANPWPGLAPFTEQESSLFHGRDEEIRALLRLIERKPLTVLFGQSGLGKSSLLQAGVFPQLRATGYCPSYIRLDHSEGAPPPAEQVKAFVRDASARAGTWTKPGVAQPGESLWEFFHHRDDRLIGSESGMGILPISGGPKQTHEQDARATSEPPTPGKFDARTIIPVLVIDQFEELFTLGAGVGAQRDRAVAFMNALAELVENRVPDRVVARLEQSPDDLEAFDFSRTDYRVCLSLREDFLPQLETLAEIMPALMENRMRLTRMTGTQALAAVLKPGAGLVNEAVARTIVEFVSGARGGSAERLAELTVEPPLLSVICHELNERRRALGLPQITADLVTGNRREILNDFYERSVADLPAAMRAFVEDKLLTKSGFRDNLALETALEEPGVTQPLIDTLVSRRLLRLEDRIGVQRVELTHDVLADVVRNARDARQQRLALAQSQERERLALAAAARRTHRQRWIIGGLTAAVVALLVGAFFGIRAQRRATEQASQLEIVLGSRLLDEGKLTDGLAYLVSAARKDPANRVLAPRILSALAAHNLFLPVGTPFVLPSPALSASYAADGRRIFVQSEDDTLRAIDASEWKIEREFTFDQKIRRGGYTTAEKNNDVFAVVLVDNTVLLVDATTGAARIPPISPPDRITGRTPKFALSPDGRWLAVSGATTVSLWDAQSGELKAKLPTGSSWSRNFTFSPDGRRIATTHGARITQMWSVPDGMPVGNPIAYPNSRGVVDQKFSSNGKRLLVWHYDGALVCDADTGLPLGPLARAGSSYLVDELWLTPDGSRLVEMTGNRVSVVDVATGNPMFPPLVHSGPIFAGGFARDGRILFTNSVDGLFRLWDLEKGVLLAEPTFKQAQYTPAAVSPDGRTVALFSSSGPAYRLRLGSGAATALVLPRNESVAAVNLMPTAPTRLAWLTPTEYKAIDAASGREVDGGYPFPGRILGPAGNIRSGYGQTLGPGQTLIVQTKPAGQPDRWRAWALGERAIAQDVLLTDVPEDVPFFRFNHTGDLASATGSVGRNVVGIWNLRSGRPVARIESKEPVAGGGTQISQDEKLVVFATTDGAVHVCEISSGKELSVLQLSGRASLAAFRFAPNSKQLLTGDDWGGMHVWDALTGKLVRSTQTHRAGVRRIDISINDQYYASSSDDGSVQVWETATHLPVGTPLVQAGAPARTDFSPDAMRIITPSNGGTARIWDVRSGLPLTGLLDHEGEPVGVVCYGPDGRFIETFSTSAGKRVIRVWAVPPDGRGAPTPKWLLTLATICAGQRLTDGGKFVSAADEFAKIEDARRELDALPANDPYAEWGRWILSDSPTRPIAPGFTITPTDAEKLAQELAAAAAPATRP